MTCFVRVLQPQKWLYFDDFISDYNYTESLPVLIRIFIISKSDWFLLFLISLIRYLCHNMNKSLIYEYILVTELTIRNSEVKAAAKCIVAKSITYFLITSNFEVIDIFIQHSLMPKPRDMVVWGQSYMVLYVLYRYLLIVV